MIRIATPKPTLDFLFAYNGRELGGDLQFNNTRHFDPTVGRFISEEPAAYAGDADLCIVTPATGRSDLPPIAYPVV